MRSVPILVLAAAALLGGCVQNDPLVREGLWRPAQVNRADLALQVANPADLVRGVGASTSDGQLAAAAVERLRTDKVKKLPDSNLSQLEIGGSGSNNSAGGAGGGLGGGS